MAKIRSGEEWALHIEPEDRGAGFALVWSCIPSLSECDAVRQGTSMVNTILVNPTGHLLPQYLLLSLSHWLFMELLVCARYSTKQLINIITYNLHKTL